MGLSQDIDGSQLEDVIQAMERIRATRQTPLQLDLFPDIWLDPPREASVRRQGRHWNQDSNEQSHFAGFIGGMVAQQAAASAV